MASLIAWTLKRRITISMLLLATSLVGGVSYFLLPVELMPRGFSEAEATVWIPVISSTPAEVQEQIVRPTEELVRTIPGVTEVRTRARQNGGQLQVSFNRNTDLSLSLAELRDRVERARATWPEEARDFFIWQFNLDTDIPVFMFAVDLERRNDDRLTFLVEEKILKPIEALPGVARVNCWGLLDDQVRIYLDRNRARALGISIYELTQSLEDSNLELSSGVVEDGEVRFAVRTDARFRDLEQIRSLPINRRGLTLGEIARVEPAKSVRQFVALSRNRPALWCEVYKESSANTVETADRVRALVRDVLMDDPRLAEIGAFPRLYDRADVGAMIVNALNSLKTTASTGAFLALFVLMFFLRRLGPTLVITFSIPLSLLLTMSWMWLSGGSLNLFSMIGVTVSIGMLIDNAIVVVENIARHRNLGKNPVEAAWGGASEVALAITLSTLTTVAAFVPVIFLIGDDQIRFFSESIGLPLCVAVVASLFVALVFIPLGTVVMESFGTRKPAGAAAAADGRMPRAAAKLLGGVLRHRFWAFLTVVSMVVVISMLAWNLLPKVDGESDSGGRVGADVRFDANMTFQNAFEEMTSLGEWLEEVKDEVELEHFWCFFRRSGGSILVDLSHTDRAKTQAAAKWLKENAPQRPGVRLEFKVEGAQDNERGKLSLDLYGPDPSRLVALSEEVAEVIEGVPGVLSVSADVERAEPEIHVKPDREKLSRQGVDPRALRGTITYGVRGWRVSDLRFGEREIPMIIEYEGSADRDLPELAALAIPSLDGREIPLSALASIETSRGLGEISRRDERSSVRLLIEPAVKDRQALARKVGAAVSGIAMPEGYGFQATQQATASESRKKLMNALLGGAVLVFLLMGVMFESLVLPLAVLVAIPFAWAGGIWSLAVTGTPLDIVGSISFIVLGGIVVNNGIVLIDCAHRLRDGGLARREALIGAVRTRLRPILMTASTTIVGLLPMAISDGGGSEVSYKALARSLIGGLVVSTFFTLFFVPLTYSALDDVRKYLGGALRRSLKPATAKS